MKCFLSLIVLFALTQVSDSQCPNCPNGGCANGVCGVPTYTNSQKLNAINGWYLLEDGKLGLWVNDQWVGTLNPNNSEWLTAGNKTCINLTDARDGLQDKKKTKKIESKKVSVNLNKCGPNCICDECDKANCVCCGDVKHLVELSDAAKEDVLNFGNTRQPKEGETCNVNGKPVSCKKLIAAIEGSDGDASNIPDDTKTPRLLLLSKDVGLRTKFISDAKTLGNKAIAQAYAPDDWAIQRQGEKALYTMPTDPTVYMMDGDGKVRAHASSYSDANDLTKYLAFADKLRTPNPNVDPLNTPDANKPLPVKPSSPASDDLSDGQKGVVGGGIAAAGLVGIVFLKRKRKVS